MFIPDLFGAYMKGREYANDQNWKDLKYYEQVEAARNANDLAALDILGQRAQFGGKMNIFQNNVDNSARANEVAEAAQPGLLANADTGSMTNMDQRSAFINNRGDYQQMLNNTAQANIGKGIDAAAVQMGANEYLTPERTGQMGAWRGADSYNTSMANNITTGYAPTAATQGTIINDEQHQNNLLGLKYDRGQLEGSISRQPAMNTILNVEAGNRLGDAQLYWGNREASAKNASEQQRLAIMERITTLMTERNRYAADPMMAGTVQALDQQIARYQSMLPPMAGQPQVQPQESQVQPSLLNLNNGMVLDAPSAIPANTQGQVQPAVQARPAPQAAPQPVVSTSQPQPQLQAVVASLVAKANNGEKLPAMIMVNDVPYRVDDLLRTGLNATPAQPQNGLMADGMTPNIPSGVLSWQKHQVVPQAY